MARIAQKRIWWEPVADATAYRVYVRLAQPTPFNYAAPYIDTTETSLLAPAGFPPGTFDVEGSYEVFITALDAVGNESNPFVLTGLFDLIPPGPPMNGGIEDFGYI